MSDACEMADFVEPPPMNNNKETEEKQTSKSKKKKKASAQDSTNSEDVVEITKRKEVESEVKKSSPHPLVTTSSEDSVQNSNKSSKRKKENISLDALIITTEKPTKVVVSAPVQQQRNGPELDTLKKSKQPADVTEIAVTTSVTSPKRHVKREEGWKEVLRRGPVTSRENSSSNLGSGSRVKKSQSSDRSSGTLSVIQSSERSKKVTVPSNAISRVIGRAGCNINSIRDVLSLVPTLKCKHKAKVKVTALS